MNRFGMLLYSFRTTRKLGLREAARILNLDNGNYCKLEQGRMSPPNSIDKVRVYKKGLKLNSSEFQELVNAAFKHHYDKLRYKFELTPQPSKDVKDE